MKKILNSCRYLAIILICLLCLTPFLILLILSLNTPQRNFYEGHMLIPDFYFANFAMGWEKSNIGRAMVNSGIITRFPIKMNKGIFSVLLCCMMVPGIINTVPLYTLMIKINAVNTLWGMACVCATTALPQAVFVFTGFIKALPKEVEEAAVIDGCSWTRVFWNIDFPLLKPSISAVVILNAFGIWNNYSQAVFFLQDSRKHNVPQALSVYFQQFAGAKWNLMAATEVIAVIPVVAAFLLFQKNLMHGLTDGALKG